MKPALHARGRDRGPPRDERTAIRLTDRRLFFLIPDQRPAERVTPEVPDRRRAVAGDRAEASTVSQERVGRLDEAELVAFGIGQHHVAFVAALTDVDMVGAVLDQPPDRFLLVSDG